ncbi:hypothetical protein J437_LFUL010121 [Ladona fulva]|uniref:Reverse transcriptase RNase H-like domain-containing protein n=1 Tax=Ladona fulva TaxID=123851 RepID=A0A8K0KIJ3_LADFU|nr:hypothetical protein J437_LFUL010121 [Ladona fulva]
MPRFDQEFHLFVDASHVALGAVLNHKIDGKFSPVAYASKTLNTHEQKLSSYELECMAYTWAVDKFKEYIQVMPFHLYTDNEALTWLFSHPKQLGKIGRMVLKLSTYKFTVHHVPLSFVDIRIHQKQDPFCLEILNKFSKPKVTVVKVSGTSYALKDGILCCILPRSKTY